MIRLNFTDGLTPAPIDGTNICSDALYEDVSSGDYIWCGEDAVCNILGYPCILHHVGNRLEITTRNGFCPGFTEEIESRLRYANDFDEDEVDEVFGFIFEFEPNKIIMRFYWLHDD